MFYYDFVPFSPPDRKLVTIESFSDVVNLAKIADFLDDHGSKLSILILRSFTLFLFERTYEVFSHCYGFFYRESMERDILPVTF